MHSYKILDWDSAFFGYKVATLLLPVFGDGEFRNVLRTLREEQVKLAYWSPENSGNGGESDAKIASLGGRRVDIKTVYRLSLEGNSPDNFKRDRRVTEYTDHFIHPGLVDLALESGIFSRYKVDERIGKRKFEELYRIWVEESVAKRMAKTI